MNTALILTSSLICIRWMVLAAAWLSSGLAADTLVGPGAWRPGPAAGPTAPAPRPHRRRRPPHGCSSGPVAGSASRAPSDPRSAPRRTRSRWTWVDTVCCPAHSPRMLPLWFLQNGEYIYINCHYCNTKSEFNTEIHKSYSKNHLTARFFT